MGSAQVFILGENFHTLVTQKVGIQKKNVNSKRKMLNIWKISPNF